MDRHKMTAYTVIAQRRAVKIMKPEMLKQSAWIMARLYGTIIRALKQELSCRSEKALCLC